jgi:hypothetical protein
VTFPALPQPMTRGASYPHARIKAQALVQRHLREVAPRGRATAARALPLAA